MLKSNIDRFYAFQPQKTEIDKHDYITQYQQIHDDRHTAEIGHKTNILGTALKELKDIFLAIDQTFTSSSSKYEIYYDNFGNGRGREDLSKDKEVVKVFKEYVKSFNLKEYWFDVNSKKNRYFFELKKLGESAFRLEIEHYDDVPIHSELRIFMPVSNLEFYIYQFKYVKNKTTELGKLLYNFMSKIIKKKKKIEEKYTGRSDEIFYRMIYGIIGIKKDKYTIQEKQEIDNLLSKENMNLYNKFSKVLKLVSFNDAAEIKRKLDKFFEIF